MAMTAVGTRGIVLGRLLPIWPGATSLQRLAAVRRQCRRNTQGRSGGFGPGLVRRVASDVLRNLTFSPPPLPLPTMLTCAARLVETTRARFLDKLNVSAVPRSQLLFFRGAQGRTDLRRDVIGVTCAMPGIVAEGDAHAAAEAARSCADEWGVMAEQLSSAGGGNWSDVLCGVPGGATRRGMR